MSQMTTLSVYACFSSKFSIYLKTKILISDFENKNLKATKDKMILGLKTLKQVFINSGK